MKIVTVEEIVVQITNNKWLLKKCVSLVGSDLGEDLAQDIALILLEKPHDPKLLKAIERGEHLFYIMRIIKNQGASKNSKFYYQYKKHNAFELNEETLILPLLPTEYGL